MSTNEPMIKLTKYLSPSLICFFIFIGQFIIFINPLQSQDNSFVIKELKDSYELNQYVQLVADSREDLDINSVLNTQSELDFRNFVPGQSLSPDSSYWLRVVIDNQLDNARILKDWKLFFGNVDLIEVYKVSEAGDIKEISRGGNMYSSAYKMLKFGNKFNRVNISLEEYPVTLFMNVSKVNKSDLSLDLVLTRNDFYQSWDYIKLTRWQWLILGFFLTMMVFNFIFQYETRDKAFLYHGLFILGVVVFNLEFFAVTHDLPLVRTKPILKQIVDYCGLAIMDIAYYQFIRYFLNLNTTLPRWDRLFKTAIYLKILVFGFVIVHYYFFQDIPLTDSIVAIFLISQYLIVAVFLVPVFRLKDRKGIFLIMGSILVFLGIFVNAIRVVQGMPILILPTLIGITGEIFCFSLGLGYRMKKLKDDALEEERKTVARLKEIDGLKNQFLANTSHELKTPLQGIIGLSENLLEREDDAATSEDLSIIINSGKRLSSLINDILDFSKIKNNDLTLNIKPVDLKIITEIIVRMVQPFLKNKNIELSNLIPSGLPHVLADENRLQQILYNLVNNAIKFTEKGYVKIYAEVVNSELEISVEDSGIGIPMGKSDEIFKAFKQADGSISREYQGTGLGLSISRQLIELQGGQIFVDSKPGEGSVFKFTLPIVDKEVTPVFTESVKQENESSVISGRVSDQTTGSEDQYFFDSSRSSGKFNILVVDDEPINQHVIRGHLEDKIYNVKSLMSGSEAIEFIFHNNNTDLVILDLMMPRMSGYEVCKKIRERYLPSELPIIIVTAKNQIQDLIQGFNLGANDYLTKPFTKLEFLARVKTQLNLNYVSRVTNKFVPNDFIRSLGRETVTEVRIGDHVEKNVSVLFSDIRGYTSISEGMSLDANFDFVLNHVSEMGPIIVNNNGFVNQYLGDSIMAIFGRNPKDALSAAVAMQKKITHSNSIRNDDQPELNVGIGFHTGNLMMGIIGDEFHSKPVTIADTVNIASRIEGLTKYFGTKILLSDTSLDSMKDTDGYDFRFLGQVQLKGKSRHLGLYECINGDPEDIYLKKKESMAQFKEGLECFFSKKFPSATVIFQDILSKNPKDSPASHFLRKAAESISKGVPEDWTGIEVMDIK